MKSWGEETLLFNQLSPDRIDEVVTQLGLQTNGELLALNALENRVYRVGIENFNMNDESLINHPYDIERVISKKHIIIKFYRPGRWTEDAIKEEHRYVKELASKNIPVIMPLIIRGETLHYHHQLELYFTIYPLFLGRLKDEVNEAESRMMARSLALIHNASINQNFKSRPLFDIQTYILDQLEYIDNSPLLDKECKKNYILLGQHLTKQISPYLQTLEYQKIHGDFHRGNVIWTDCGPVITDFDDCCNGPVQQDLWPMFLGRDQESIIQRNVFLDHYNEMAIKPVRLSSFMLETLRTIRMIHYTGWILRRWDDPMFQDYFDQFLTISYWQQQCNDLKEQIAIIQDEFANI